MKPLRALALLPLTFALIACGSSEPPPPPAPPAPPREQDRHLERAIHAPLDRARAVEGDVMKAKREQDAKIEEEGG